MTGEVSESWMRVPDSPINTYFHRNSFSSSVLSVIFITSMSEMLLYDFGGQKYGLRIELDLNSFRMSIFGFSIFASSVERLMSSVESPRLCFHDPAIVCVPRFSSCV